MSAKTTKTAAQNNNVADEAEGKVPTVEPAPAPFDFNATLNAAERDVEAAFVALLMFVASQSTVETQNNIVHRLADVLDGEGKTPRAADYPSAAALHKRLKRLFGAKGVLTLANMARACVGRTPILG